jgi:acetyl-CoA carboxylase biotin carboxyl carrier protein
MSEDRPVSDADPALLRALCDEARSLATSLRGPLARITLSAGDHHVEVEWPAASTGVPVAAGAGPSAGGGSAMSAGTSGDGGADGDEPVGERIAIAAPLVGVFYRSPEPGSKPFVEEGDVVEPGQDVAIVEAMKIMNRVQADRGGRVAKILASDGDMVEFGQELMLLEPLDGGA